MSKKINIVTLGCAKNIVDSEHLAAQCATSGYEVVFDSDDTSAKVVVINTCGFILDAKQESIEMILSFAQAKERGEIDRLFVFGCLSERYKDELKEEIEEVDSFFGATNIEDVLEALGGDYDQDSDTSRVLTTLPHYAYLKISEGCNWGCGYCAIPLIRGRHRSVPMEDLLKETAKLAEQGIKELIIVAQDSTYYGLDLYGSRQLAELLRRICRVDGIEWVRLHYAYPAQFPLDVLDVMASEPKMCKYLDIPLQHVSDKMLSSMRRGLSSEQTRELVSQIRERVPGVTLRTTLITGYPGESEEDFQELLAFVEEAKFDRLGVFPYSPEEGTYSYKNLEDDVPEEVKEQRRDAIMELQMGISSEINSRLVGRRLKVIIDSELDGTYIGRYEGDSPEVDGEIYITSDNKLEPGSFYEATITMCDDYDLYASV